MELNEFVSLTLCEIVKGVVDAQSSLTDMGAIISPMNIQTGEPVTVTGDNRRIIDRVQFELAITDTNLQEGKKGIGVLFANIGAGSQNNKSLENTSLTRIKFSIPVCYPTK